MSTQNQQQRLAAEARQRCVNARKEREKRRSTAPRTGDVLRLDATADLGVLWALVEHEGRARQFLAVVADLSPLVGSSDVAVPPASAGGALSLRCAVEVWLDEGDLSAASLAGSLEHEVVEQVRRKRSEIVSGDVAGSLFARETDGDPEYRDWMEEGPEKAQALLLHRRPSNAQKGRILDFPGARDRFLGIPASIAASVLLVSSLGLLAGLLWQSRGPAGRSAAEQVNLPFAVLAAGQVRDRVETLEVPSSASSFLLLVETDASYPRYRLEIREGSDGLVWASDQLRPTKERASRLESILLTAVLPRQILATGEYRVLLFGLRHGRQEGLEEHQLRVQKR